MVAERRRIWGVADNPREAMHDAERLGPSAARGAFTWARRCVRRQRSRATGANFRLLAARTLCVVLFETFLYFTLLPWAISRSFT
jgi:hypothetical protein